MRKAIMILQTLKNNNNSLSATVKIQKPGYEDTIEEICKMALNEQTPKQLKMIRSKFYDLLVKGITADLVLLLMVKYLLKNVDKKIKLSIVEYGVLSDFRCQLGSKDIIHLEAFTATIMMIKSRS
jgi:replication factor C subunit 3/5